MKTAAIILIILIIFSCFASADDNVRIANPPTYYNTIQEAYNAAQEGDVIQAKAVWFNENLNFNRAISVTLEGGYNSDFSDNSADESILIGSFETLSGKITAENIIVTRIGGIGADDENPPSGSVIINEGHTYTDSITVTLILGAEDGESGLDSMKFSNDGINWSTPEAYSTTKIWDLILGDGEKTVYVKFSDKAENWSDAYSDTITLDSTPDNTPPEITEVTPQENSKFYEEDLVDVSAVVTDTDPTPLDYRFSIDAEIKQGWSSVDTYIWSAEHGTHLIKTEVWDTGGEDSQEYEVYGLRKPIEYPEQ